MKSHGIYEDHFPGLESSMEIGKFVESHEKSWKMIIMSCNFLQKLHELKNSE